MSIKLGILERIIGKIQNHDESKQQARFDCPLCSYEDGVDSDGKQNLEVNYGYDIFNCWKCGDKNHMHGRLRSLVKRFGEKKDLKEFDLISGNIVVEKKKKVFKGLPKEFKSLSTANKRKAEVAKCLRYLNMRGIDDELIKKFNIGYCEDGRYGGRIIFPSYDVNGRLNHFIARTYVGHKTKYLGAVNDKSKIIFNEKFINWNSTVVLVEGVFEHILIPNSIPLLGKNYIVDLIDTIIEKANSFIIIALDGDAIEDAIKFYFKMSVGKNRNNVRIVRGGSDDLDEIYAKGGKKALAKKLLENEKLRVIDYAI